MLNIDNAAQSAWKRQLGQTRHWHSELYRRVLGNFEKPPEVRPGELLSMWLVNSDGGLLNIKMSLHIAAIDMVFNSPHRKFCPA